VPSTVVEVTQWPRTPSGKIDRSRLSAPPPVKPPGAGLAPRTAAERGLARIWEEVLQYRPVARTDDFFALGGHSLLAMRLVARIREKFGVAVAVRDLLAAPTLEGLAARLERAGLAPVAQTVRIAASAWPEGSLPVSPEQRFRLARERWRRKEGYGPGTHHVSAACAIDGSLRLDALEQALNDVVSRHEALHARFAIGDNGEEWQKIGPVQPVRLHQLTVPREADPPPEVVAEWATAPFDLASGLLLRAVHWNRGDTREALLLVCDHIVSDQVSMAVILNDLKLAYAGRCVGMGARWEGPATSYGDFLHEEAAWLASSEANDVTEEWRAELDGTSPFWPTGLQRLPRPARRRFRAGAIAVSLPGEAVADLTQVARTRGASLYHALLALVAVVLFDITGQERIGVLTPMANRETAGADRLVAYTANTLPVVQDVAPHLSFGEQIERARNQAMTVLARQRMPLAEIVRRLAPEEFGPPPIVSYTLVNYIEADLLRASTTPIFAGAHTAPLTIAATTSPAPLIIALLDAPERLTIQVTYDRDLVAPETAGRVVRALAACAQHAAASVEEPVAATLAKLTTNGSFR
jgi:hypothetical protein